MGKTMNLERRVLLILAFFASVTAIFILIVSNKVFSESFHETEVSYYTDIADKISSIVSQKGTYYGAFVQDWGEWTDTYEFMKVKNYDYIAKNLSQSTLEEIDSQFIIFMNRDYTEYYSIAETGRDADLIEIEKAIRKNKLNIEETAFSEENHLILTMSADNRAVLLGVSPVYPSNMDKPANGFLFMGHILDQDFIANLFDEYGYEISIARRNILAKSEQTMIRKNYAMNIEFPSKEMAKINMTLLNKDNEAALNLFYTDKRLLYSSFSSALAKTGMIVIIFFIVITAIVYLLFYKFVTSGILSIVSSLNNMLETSNFSGQIKGTFYGETKTLAKNINTCINNISALRNNLAEISNMDKLTGVSNKRYFDEIFLYEWNKSIREKKPLGLLIIDIDSFRTYNENYSHIMGDKCLARIAGIMREVLKRNTDIIARFGGEEFAVLLSNTDRNGLEKVAEDILEAVRKADIPHAYSDTANHVTVSIGAYSKIPEGQETKEILLLEADKALYEAKKSGKDKYIIGEQK
jgi:diguanylate cyclase (GGDEF)-like protein